MNQANKMRDRNYYYSAKKGSSDLSHPGMKILIKMLKNKSIILDMGCGEGTRLAKIIQQFNSVRGFGVDINQLAISLAKKKYPYLKFVKSNLEKLPFRSNFFDFIFSAFVFEHLTQPEKVLIESIRVTKPQGKIIIIAPNFGAPNRRSPNSTENKIKKLFNGLLKNLTPKSYINLEWTRVTPQKEEYSIDGDTTIEPDLHSLIKFAENLGLEVEYSSSNWPMDRFSLFQLPFRILGALGVYPFWMWGPHLCVVFKKT